MNKKPSLKWQMPLDKFTVESRINFIVKVRFLISLVCTVIYEYTVIYTHTHTTPTEHELLYSTVSDNVFLNSMQPFMLEISYFICINLHR